MGSNVLGTSTSKQKLSIDSVLEQIRKESTSKFDKGRRFEVLMQRYLSRSKLYSEFDEVLLWSDWRKTKGDKATDDGIDLVAKTTEGDYCAIQCKFYKDDANITQGAINSFLSTSSKRFEGKPFAKRLLITTSSNWGKNSEQLIANQDPPVTRIHTNNIRQDVSISDWSELTEGIVEIQGELEETYSDKNPKGKHQFKDYKTPKIHQQKAIESVVKGFESADLGKLIMACGTGKTFTSLQIAEEMLAKTKGKVLFLVPSLSLLNQTLREWSIQCKANMKFMAVCSDDRVNVSKNDEGTKTYDLLATPTTDPKKIASAVNNKKVMTVVFSTYQSLQAIIDAQHHHQMSDFDLVICDEAHRATGAKNQTFTLVHKDKLKAKKRLFMTATPRIYSEAIKSKVAKFNVPIASMDDEDIFGKEFFRYDFSQAVKDDELSEYELIVMKVPEGDAAEVLKVFLDTDSDGIFEDGSGIDDRNKINLEDAAKIIGCSKALSGQVKNTESLEIEIPKMKTAVAFAKDIKASKLFAKYFEGIVNAHKSTLSSEDKDDHNLVECSADHTDGTEPTPTRDEKVYRLKSHKDNDGCHVLSNVRCLSEGVDVPSLDAVIFLNSRKSQVDIVQAVGRVMRKAKGKKRGYIILPVVIDETKEIDQELSSSKYKVVWQVANALMAHDERFNIYINQLVVDLDPSNKTKKTQSNGPRVTILNSGDCDFNEADVKQGALFSDKIRQSFIAHLAKKCGSLYYLAEWSEKVADIAHNLIVRIKSLVINNDGVITNKNFEMFLKGIRKNLNPSVSVENAIEMLAQHLITKPVFDALFKDYAFMASNPVSITMEKMIVALNIRELSSEYKELEGFYTKVQNHVEQIQTPAGRQKVLAELYEKFFKVGFKKMHETLGIIYTPVEIVDFILHSADHLVKKEFNKSGIGSNDVHLLDPFTGTGTFIVRLLESKLISDDEIHNKYLNEIHANEIVPLAYYIAAINIESSYHGRITKGEGYSKYEPFPGICFVDTFQSSEDEKLTPVFSLANTERLKKQKETDIKVVIGNPPYSAGQKSANDNAANLEYPTLDESIRDSYALNSSATNKNSLYDSYIRAFRWASNRIGKEGVVAFVTNASFLEGKAMDGFRKVIAEEFSSVYCFNLRGNARKSGEDRRKEKGNVFGEGTRTPIAITILVKKLNHTGNAKIHYHDIGDYLSQKEKLNLIDNIKSIENIEWKEIKPNTNHDWINQRSTIFGTFFPIGDKSNKKVSQQIPSVFNIYSNNVVTGRDAWACSFDKQQVINNMKSCICFYNEQRQEYHKPDNKIKEIEDFINKDPTKISWDRQKKKDLLLNKSSNFDKTKIHLSNYRPYCKQWLYFDRQWNSYVGRQPKFFPGQLVKNHAICIPGLGETNNFSALMIDVVSDLHILQGSQCFPRYHYEQLGKDEIELDEKQDISIGFKKIDNIPQSSVDRFNKHYQQTKITGDCIFYYVYAIFHSPQYNQKFAADLKKVLARIPFAETYDDFVCFSKKGKQLADIHCGYEDETPFAGIEIEEKGDFKSDSYYEVSKKGMKFAKEGKVTDKTVIHYNDNITISGIPLEAYDYIVNGKSAIEWVIDRYKITQHKDSKIVNNPNHYSEEPKYILDLLRKVISISVKSVEIVESLPKIKF